MSTELISEPPVQDPPPVAVPDPPPVTSWRDVLGDEIKDHPALTTLKDVPALANSFLETKEMVGRRGIILPKEGNAADLARFRKEIGVPEEADGYDLGDFAPPEGLPWDDDFQKTMLDKLHKIGIPNGQIKQLFSDYAETQADQYAAMHAAVAKGHETTTASLQKEFGAEYTASVARGKRVLKEAAGEHSKEVAGIILTDGTALGDHPAFVRTLISIGNQYAEAGLLGDKEGGVGFTMSQDAAEAEMDQIIKNDALYDVDHPDQKQLQARKNELAEMAFPEMKPEVL